MTTLRAPRWPGRCAAWPGITPRPEAIDLSRRIGDLAGRRKAAAVYRARAAGEAVLLPTDAGLWRMDARGSLRRVELDGATDEATVVILPRPDRPAAVYVGALAQRGGKVYAVDVRTGRAELTGGYCGYGPEQYLAEDLARVRCGYAVQALWERRRSRQQTAPAR